MQSLLAPPAYLKGGRRADRLVAWADGKLACFTPGDAKPLWSGNALAQQATGIYWLAGGSRLLAWNELEVAMVDGGNGAAGWRAALSGLPTIDVSRSAAMVDGPLADRKAPAAPEPPTPAEAQAQIRAMRMGGMVAVQPVAADAAPAAGDEQERIARISATQ